MKTCAQIVAVAGTVLVAGCASEPRPVHRPEPMVQVQSEPSPVASTGPRARLRIPPPMNVSLLSVQVKPGASASGPRGASALTLSSDGTDEGGTPGVVMTGVSRVTFAEEGADFDPCVSRDGKKLVFASTQHRTNADIYWKKTDSRVVTQLTNDPGQDAMPAISPDGKSIAFASDRTGNWDIYVMPVTGGRAVQVTSDSADDVHPSWSPDGRSLVFSRQGQASGRWEMWVTEVANPAVANFIGYGVLPQWCPVAGTGSNGSDKVLFQLGRERGRRTFSLWTVEISNGTTGNTTEIASSAETALIDPSWSPDGQWVVYTEVPVDGSDSRPQWATLWMISGEGEGKVRLTDGTGLALSPVWGGNDRLFFVSDRSGKDNIWSLDLGPAVRSAQAALGAGVSPTTATAAAPANAKFNESEPVANGPASIEEHTTASEKHTDQ
ncbi:MAG TPA: DPP IV N-terminal domain-containing protein [Phycisphaerales bacterium]|nr:DPP IV N-terminal domain-containing protein [Phycisphaerales bacterium]